MVRPARVLRAAVVPVVLVALTALPGLVIGRVFADSLLAILVGGAAAGSVAVSVAARRLPSWSVAPLSVLLLGGYAVFALRTAASRAAVTEPLTGLLADALVNGIPGLLTAMIPVESTPDTVAVPVVLAWLAGLTGTEVAVRAQRVLLGCVPATAFFVGALYIVGPNADAARWPASAFAALVAVALAASAGGPAPLDADVTAAGAVPIPGRTLAGTAAGVVVVVGLIAVVTPAVGGLVAATPVDPRRYVQPPQVDSLDESPLARISGWTLNPDQPLFEIRASPTATPAAPVDGSPARPGASSGGDSAGARARRLRLAVLPDYDGVTWRVGGVYRNAGRVLPKLPALPGARVETVRQEITVTELTGRLLPAVPTPTAVQGTRVAFDGATGTIIRPEGITPGVRYAVTSQRAEPNLNMLPRARVPTGAEVSRFLAAGAGVPPQVRQLADRLAGENGAPYDRARAIEEFLGEHYREVADAPSGHAYPNLSFFLFGPVAQGGQQGTSEQFAASFAVLARLVGLPSRVVVGFDAPTAGGAVTGAHASAWPEVLFEGLGWVAFDPMPPRGAQPRPVDEALTAAASSSTPPPSTSAPTTSPPPSAPTAAAAPPSTPAAGSPPWLAAATVVAAVVLVSGAAAGTVILLRRSQRRRRLTVGGPPARIAGAWLEFTDALRLAGRPAPAHLAATEAAAHAATAPMLRPQVPGPDAAPLPPVDDLVAGVNASAFGPTGVDDVQAERAARQAVAYADALRAQRSRWSRAVWALHPGPLRWHRRR